MAVEIPLTRGAVALVDAADAPLLLAYRWQLWVRGPHRYAATTILRDGKRRSVGMHRLVMGEPAGMSVDHIDGDGLNNTRANLRIVTRGQNSSNRVKRAAALCAFKGVYRVEHRFRAQINSETLPAQPWFIGDFSTAVDAARAYDACARIVFGAHARVNFPRPGEVCAVPMPAEAA